MTLSLPTEWDVQFVESPSATLKLIQDVLNMDAVSGNQYTKWVFKVQDWRIERMDRGVRV